MSRTALAASARAALCLFTVSFVAQGAPAQESPEALLDSLLSRGATIDAARSQVEEEYDEATAADLVVFLCSPPAVDACTGSQAAAAWSEFEGKLDELGEDETASDLVAALQPRFGAYLASGVAVSWCSFEDDQGCAGDPITQSWSAFNASLLRDPNPSNAFTAIEAMPAGPIVAELIAVSECGEATCFREELEDWDFEDSPPALKTQAATPRQRGPRLAFNASDRARKVLDGICDDPRGAKLERCKGK